MLCAAPALAESPAALRAQIEAAGTHARPGIERHTVRVQDCTMTTFWWRSDQPGEGELLWSSFSFDMSLTPIKQPARGGPSAAVPGGGADGADFVMVFFEPSKSAPARHERLVLRAPKADLPVTPSPRGVGTTHYFQDSGGFFFRHEGAGVIEKAKRFVDAYMRYVDAHCRFTS